MKATTEVNNTQSAAFRWKMISRYPVLSTAHEDILFFCIPDSVFEIKINEKIDLFWSHFHY